MLNRFTQNPFVSLFFAALGRQRSMPAPAETAAAPFRRGSVAIVGAGPGDPDLLTLAALRHLRKADAIVYDRLVNAEILDLANDRSKLIYVGKAKDRHTASQAEINALLVSLAQAGNRVVRLKGGDPFIFGRGGEEIDHLADAGIATTVVPGITAAAGCAAAACIPLTHRDFAHSVTFVSGHGPNGPSEVDWRALARDGQTLAVYMGLSTAGAIADTLIREGLAATTPVAVIENGTLPSQKTVTGVLIDIEGLIGRHNIEGPALLIIGEVARFADVSQRLAPLRLVA